MPYSKCHSWKTNTSGESHSDNSQIAKTENNAIQNAQKAIIKYL